MEAYFKTVNMAVGYHKTVLIHDINIEIEKGKILTLIGPNGAGKSTILKSITRQIAPIKGTVWVGKNEISRWSGADMAKNVSVVLTDRIRPELMTCAEVVALGRYPYTDLIGRLTKKDKEKIQESLCRVHALDLSEQEFSTLSDGQKQRIMLARAICQEPEVIVLDEPTAYLDIRHKIEILEILREMAKDKNVTVIMSLHEIDLAAKISDYLICVKGDTLEAFGTSEKILESGMIEKLYDVKNGSFNSLFGSVELKKTEGKPELFVIGGGGFGISCYRALQKNKIPFATGILFENDIDYQVAKVLSDFVISVPSFEPMEKTHFDKAADLLLQCRKVIDSGTPIGSLNQMNQQLFHLAREHNIPIQKGI